MMKAVVFDNGKLRFEGARPEPKPGPGEALIKVALAGICRTDLEIAGGYMGFSGIPGHEFAGVIEECADAGSRGSAWQGR